MKNPWRPWTQGEFAPTHRFLTDFHWGFMKKTGGRAGDVRKPSLRVQTWRRGAGTKPCQDPSPLQNTTHTLLGGEQRKKKILCPSGERQATILSQDHSGLLWLREGMAY